MPSRRCLIRKLEETLLAGAFISAYPRVAGPILAFLLRSAILDTMLTLAFLLWPGVISPNYFHRVDRTIWLWNWSKPAKAQNTAGVIVSPVVAVQRATILSGRTMPAPSS